MKTNKLTKWFSLAICLLAMPVIQAASTNDSPGNWVFTLNGAGGTTTSGNSVSTFGTQLGIGYNTHFILPLELGIREGINYSSQDGGGVILATSPYADWTFLKLGIFDVFGGTSIGAVYGNIPLRCQVSPELGSRIWIQKNVAIVGRLQYAFDLNSTSVKAQDVLGYSLGLQIRF